jgi:triacylglycerol lipase
MNNFSVKIGRTLCQASADSYRESDIDNAASDIHVLIRRDWPDVVVAFRGTADARNWLTDLDCDLWHDAICGRIHRGFHCALESVWDALEGELCSAKCGRLWVTGHSLGGALAMLFAWYWDGPIAGVYTFGQPRVGNARFRDNYNFMRGRRTFRVVHGDDIVPRVPWRLGMYRHAGHEVFATRSGEFRVDQAGTAKVFCELRNAWRELGRKKVALLADHHVNTYLPLFQSNRAGAFVS